MKSHNATIMHVSRVAAIHRVAKYGSVILVVILMLLPACNDAAEWKQDKRPTTAQNKSASQWVFKSPERRPLAVVFVHGIFGDAIGTWTHPNGTSFFDIVHEAKGIGDKADIYAFGYTSKMLKEGSLTIDEASNTLDYVLEDAGVWDYEQVVFVAHSMGGLVLMHELTMNPERASNVPLLMFYATPQQGSQITNIARHVVDNDAIRQMLPVDGNDFLTDLNNRWVKLRSTGQAPTIVCAYEKATTHGVMIVQPSSASKFCDQVASPIGGADHLTIVKPENTTADAAIRFRVAMKEHVLPTLDATVWKMSELDTSAEPWTFDLTNVNDFNSFEVQNRSAVRQWIRVANEGQNLFIPSELERRRVGPGVGERVRMFVHGNLKPSYEFTMQLGSTPPRPIRVRIASFEQALAARAERDAARAQRMGELLDGLRANGEFDALTLQQQQIAISKIAYQAANEQLPSAPAEVNWVVAASTLSKVSSASTNYALAQVALHTKGSSDAQRFIDLSSEIKANASINFQIPQASIEEVPQEGVTPAHLTVASKRDADRWETLAMEMAKVPAMADESAQLRTRVLRAEAARFPRSEVFVSPQGVIANQRFERTPREGVQ